MTLTRGELDRRARALAVRLQDLGLDRRSRALLLYPPGLEFITAFFGCLYAGVVAVPAYLPAAQSADDAATVHRRRRRALRGPDQRVPEYGLRALGGRRAGAPGLAGSSLTLTDGDSTSWPGGGAIRRVRPETLAFLQYTSGSTAAAQGRHDHSRQPAPQFGPDPAMLRFDAGRAAGSSGCRCSTTWA